MNMKLLNACCLLFYKLSCITFFLWNLMMLLLTALGIWYHFFSNNATQLVPANFQLAMHELLFLRNALWILLQCHPEFKIPGLYVIDSIVRQSRHQFGADKDIFSVRFSRNIATTFHNLLACPVQDVVSLYFH